MLLLFKVWSKTKKTKKKQNDLKKPIRVVPDTLALGVKAQVYPFTLFELIFDSLS